MIFSGKILFMKLSCPLDKIHPIIFMDTTALKIRVDRVKKKEIIGIWIVLCF